MGLLKYNSRRQEANPLVWLVYLGVFSVIIDAIRVFLVVTKPGSVALGDVSPDRHGTIILMLLVSILAEGFFFWLYYRRSKYAWHVFSAIVVIRAPLYWVLRSRDVSSMFAEFSHRDIFLFLCWVLLTGYALSLRRRYLIYLNIVQGGRCNCGTEHQELQAELGERNVDSSLIATEPQYLSPGVQRRLGMFGGLFLAMMAGYYIIAKKMYVVFLPGFPYEHLLAPTVCLVGLLLPLTFLILMHAGKVRILKFGFRLCQYGFIGVFVLGGFAETILQGRISEVVNFWLPVGLGLILMATGIRGLERTGKPDAELRQLDTVPSICMYMGTLIGFFIGGRMTYGFCVRHWASMAHYDGRWVAMCTTGAFVGGVMLGAVASGFASIRYPTIAEHQNDGEGAELQSRRPAGERLDQRKNPR